MRIALVRKDEVKTSMKFNQEQRLAIESLGQNIMVSASAGSGKTTVLIARLMKRITQDEVGLDEICAMTFTEKAASEMKKRLAKALHQVNQENPSRFIKEQLSLLSTTQISTIHSFCRSIITEFGYLIGFKQDRINHLLDDLARYRIEQEVLDLVLNKYYGMDNDEFKQLSIAYSTRAFTDKALAKDIKELYTLALTQLDPYAWLEQQKTRYAISRFEESRTDLQQLLINYLTDEVTVLYEQYQSLSNNFDRLGIPYNKDWDFFMEQLVSYIDNGQWSLLVELLEDYPNLSFYKFTAKQIKANPELELLNPDIVLFRDLFNSFPWSSVYFDTSDYAYQQNLKFTQWLCALAQDYGKAYEALKEERNVLDFNDLEQAAYEILTHPSQLANQVLRKRYRDILVDEYQDTNYFQDRIIELIARDNNVFRVGDVKQSIYRFRNAKPQLMMSRMKTVDQRNQVLYLSNNYRSKENIVDFNNELFDTLMNLDQLESQYLEKDWVTTGIEQQKENNSFITLLQVEFDETIDIDGETIRINRNKALLNKIALDVKERIDQGTPAKDICILARSHAVKSDLKLAFERLNIPYFFDDFEGFSNSWSVSDMLNALQFIVNPYEDYYALAFLLSGFCALDENQVATLKVKHPNQSLFSSLEIEFPTLYQQIVTLINQIQNQPLSSQLILIAQFNGYYYDHLDENQRNNINFFFDKAKSFRGSSLDFVEYVLDDQFVRSSNAAIDDESANRVKVMTIHASKGLQFPIVYYITPQELIFRDNHQICLMDSDLGICFNTVYFDTKVRTKTHLRYAFELDNKNKEINESLRMLYVALTRAQNELILIDAKKSTQNTDTNLKPLSWRNLMDGMGHAPIIQSFLEIKPLPYVQRRTEKIQSIQSQDRVVKQAFFPYEISDYKPIAQVDFDDDTLSYDDQLSLTPHLKATEIGTILHKVISEQQNHPWTIEQLQIYPLSPIHLQQLLSFSHHEGTRDLFTGKVYHEVGFTHHINEKVLVGIMDMVVEFDDEIVLIDFKSDQVSSFEILKERYQGQIEMYRSFLRTQYPHQKIRTFIYSFSLNDYFELY